MDRRLERRRARGMPQTLDELVRDLRDAERDRGGRSPASTTPATRRAGTTAGRRNWTTAGPTTCDWTRTVGRRCDGTAHAENIDASSPTCTTPSASVDRAAKRCCTARSTRPVRSRVPPFLGGYSVTAVRSTRPGRPLWGPLDSGPQRRDRVGRSHRRLSEPVGRLYCVQWGQQTGSNGSNPKRW